MNPEQKEQNYALAETLLAEQNFQVAVFAGAVAAVLAAAIYAVVAVTAGYAIWYMAAGVGLLVGITIRYLGRGVETKFAVLASVLAVAGCVLGNVFAAILLEARAFGESPFKVASTISLDHFIELVTSTFRPADLISWLVAIAAASYFAKRRLSHEEGLAIYTYQNRREQGGIITS